MKRRNFLKALLAIPMIAALPSLVSRATGGKVTLWVCDESSRDVGEWSKLEWVDVAAIGDAQLPRFTDEVSK